jgi:hypothetical protein
MDNIFRNQLLTADPKEHINRAKALLRLNNDSFLLYSALELRLAIERIIHNEYTISDKHTKGAKSKNDPKRKKLVMNIIDPESDYEYEVFYNDSLSKKRIFWGYYKNISTTKVTTIEGKLGNLLHMHLDLNLGIGNDPWYKETRNFLTQTAEYLNERITVHNTRYS